MINLAYIFKITSATSFMFRNLIYYFALFFLIPIQVISIEIKNIGVPNIRNFTNKEYRAGTQNWSIAQDKKGFVYFGNNDGLLMFDGVNWQLHKMPNLSIVRSVMIGNDGQIYIGAYNEIGKMVASKSGKMEFRSLKKRIPEGYQNFDDIWNINSFNDQIIFQSYKCAFLLNKDSTISIIKAPSRFQNSFNVKGHMYFNDFETGLMEYSNHNLTKLKSCEKIKGEEIWSILPFKGGNELMICTLNKGIFIYNGEELSEWDVPINDFFKQKQIFSSTLIQENYYAIGTIQDGVIIIDSAGKTIQHLNRQKGLQNNTILKTFSDISGNLWLGLDNGIDYVNINSPITFLKQSDGIGSGYTSIIHNGKIYLGTNQGLFVKNWDDKDKNINFRMISGTNGQVWYLGVHDGVLLCGHNNGTFIINGVEAHQISNYQGAWKFHTLKRFPGTLICGTYSGLIHFKKVNNSWIFAGKIKGFDESCRVFEEDEEGNLWMSHGFKGIYKISIRKTLDSIQTARFYTKDDGLPTNYNLNIFKIKGRIIVASNNGIYEFNPENDRFELSDYYNQLLYPIKDISFLKEDQNGNIWYFKSELAKNTTGVFLLQPDLSYKQVTAPFSLLTGRSISGFESIYKYSDDHIFFGTIDGFAHYSPVSKYNYNSEFSTFISRGTALYLDSTFYYGLNYDNLDEHIFNEYRFPYKDNTFRFFFTSPSYENQDNIEYSFKLSEKGNKWSDWSNTPFTEYTKLPPGKYIFTVKARNQLGIESNSDSLTFTITPPWYKSVYAYIVYILLFILLILLIIWITIQRIEISKRKERLKQLLSFRQKEQEFIRQALISEKKIINLKNEKLKSEMIHRDKELANQTMDLIVKNKFLLKIKEDLEKLKNSSSEESTKDKISILIHKIEKDIDIKKQWEVFEKAFDDVHDDFLSRLKTLFPNLTPKELKLCAYLRMNISTKEIAPLMNISARGVEICRYRVRKKLDIDRDQNLTSYIINL